MSLINDALKRASQAHAHSPSTAPVGSLLQPVHVTRQTTGGWPVTTLALLVGALLTVTVMLIWQLSHRKPAMVVHAPGVTTAEQAASIGMPVADLPAEPDGATILQPGQPSAKSSQRQMTPVERLVPAIGPTTVHARGPAEPVTVGNPMEPVPVQIEPQLKLQGLVYRSSGASALVSGKTVYVGDRVLDARVTRINHNSVVLNRAGEEVVLTLD